MISILSPDIPYLANSAHRYVHTNPLISHHALNHSGSVAYLWKALSERMKYMSSKVEFD
jgi:hypothetical protein